jgi:hypothetical protein
MILEDQFDPDDILRDVGDKAIDEEDTPENVREVDFGTLDDQNANFDEMAGDLDLDLD